MLLDRNTLSSRRGGGKGEEGFVKGCLIRRTRAILGKVRIEPYTKEDQSGHVPKEVYFSKNWNLCKELNSSINSCVEVWDKKIKMVGIMG